MPLDLSGIVRHYQAMPPHRGLVDGIDPSLEDGEYHPDWAYDLENIRVGRGMWEPRWGSSLWRAFATDGSGSPGTPQLLTSVYTAALATFRLAGRKGVLYDWQEGTDVAWVAVPLPVGWVALHATNRIRGVQLGDRFYLTDQSTALRRYGASAVATAATVAQPTAAGAAPGVRARYYGILSDWTAAEIAAWSESSNGNFDISAGAATDPSPGETDDSTYGLVAKLTLTTTSARGKKITENTASESCPTNKIAFWVKSTVREQRVNAEFGVNAEGEFKFPIEPPRKNKWYIRFCDTGPITTLNYKRFRCVLSPDAGDAVWVTRLIICGKLEGEYRWRTSFYQSSDGTESEMSPVSATLDLSAIGKDYHNETEPSTKKCASVTWAYSGATDYVRIYRSGGVAELTTDPASGQPIWIKTGQVRDYTTTVGTSSIVGATSLILAGTADMSKFAVNDFIVIKRGTATEEVRRITGISSFTLTLDEAMVNAHTAPTEAVQLCFVDNVSDIEVDVTNRMPLERDDPPTGPLWIDKSPDGRLWIFGDASNPSQVSVSNKPTPERAFDYEVFPADVDPLTRQDLLQGWRFKLAAGAGDEAVVWGGFFNKRACVLTATGLWQINAYSQADWGPQALHKRIEHPGCLNGNTVSVVRNTLYWIAPGPKLMRWDGEQAPEEVSLPAIRTRLSLAPATYYSSWFAFAHTKQDGHYYCLFAVPQGQTTPTYGWQLNVDTGVWETVSYYKTAGSLSGGTLRTWNLAHVPKGGTDTGQCYAVDSTGGIYLLDDPSVNTDASIPVRVVWETKRHWMGPVSLLHELDLYLDRVTTDTGSLYVTTEDADYGTVTRTYTLSFGVSGTSPETVRLHRDLKGRRASFRFIGDLSYRAAPRGLRWRAVPIRERKL